MIIEILIVHLRSFFGTNFISLVIIVDFILSVAEASLTCTASQYGTTKHQLIKKL